MGSTYALHIRKNGNRYGIGQKDRNPKWGSFSFVVFFSLHLIGSYTRKMEVVIMAKVLKVTGIVIVVMVLIYVLLAYGCDTMHILRDSSGDVISCYTEEGFIHKAYDVVTGFIGTHF